MKTTTRRHIASLAFIVVLAVIYVVILLTGHSNTPPDNVVTIPVMYPGDTTGIHTMAVGVADSMTEPAVATSVDACSRTEAPKSRSRSKKSKPTTRPHYAPDNPDIFDLPVPEIR